MNGQDLTVCIECGKPVTEADAEAIVVAVSKEAAMAAVEHEINDPETLLSTASVCALIAFGHCLECFERNNTNEPLRVLAGSIFADPTTNPILFQWQEVTGPL